MQRSAVALALCAAFAMWSAEAQSGVLIVSHRGAKKVAPENTIAAFDAAADAGADYVELDVRQSKDGELIIMHDARVDRTTDGHGAVRDLSVEEIRRLNAGLGQQVPTFREALLWGRRRGIRIDVDHKAGSVEDIARVIRDTGMIDRVVIEGRTETLQRFAALLPGVDTMPKVASVAEIPVVCNKLRTTVVRLSTEQLQEPQSVKRVRACPARVSYTILGSTDNEDEMRRVIALGAQLIETDNPDVLARVRAGTAQQSPTRVRH